ncbi:MAG: hypothetical protein IJ411_03575 [Oscillospiraceae bacterium]|nr:hypothetical protein [Oscillospiraceae bacterium]
METVKLFDLDSYIKDFSATVLSCEEDPKQAGSYLVVLDQTAFFAEGGGQPADQGKLGGANVTHVSEKGGVIRHHCDQPLEVGSVVDGHINWDVRFPHMQTHCGEHILSGIILKEYGFHNVGFHMGKDFTTIDLDGELNADMVRNVENLVNRAIGENVPVTAAYPNKEELASIPLRKKPEVENLRVVTVSGYDWCGCCGTHVARSGEIQLLKIVDFQRYKGGTRLFFHCGQRALQDYQQKHDAVKALAEEFSCKPEGLTDAVHRLQQDCAELKVQLSEKNKLLFTFLGQQLMDAAPEVNGCKWIFLYGGLSADEAKTFAMQMSKQDNIFCTCFIPVGENVRYALSRSKNVDSLSIKALCQAMNKALGGKGGGNEDLCCGSLPLLSEEELNSFFRAQLGL